MLWPRRSLGRRPRDDSGAVNRRQFEFIDIDEAFVGDLQMRDHRKGQEGDLQEGFGQGRSRGSSRRRQRDEGAGAPSSKGRRLISPATGKASSAITSPAATTAKPPSISLSRLTATAMSPSSAPTTQILWLSWPTEEASAPRSRPKPLDEAHADVAIHAVARHDRDLHGILARDRSTPFALAQRQSEAQLLGDDLARRDADDGRRRPLPAVAAKSAAVTRSALMLSRPTGATGPRRAKEPVVDRTPGRDRRRRTAQRSRSSRSTRSAR